MKKVWVVGKSEDSDSVCSFFRSVNAECRTFLGTEHLLEAGREEIPHLVVVVYDLASKSDVAIREIRKDANLKSAQLLVCYPTFTVRAETRGRAAGADEVLLLPLERRELLASTASLLRIDKRRTFRTLLTVEAPGHSVVARSQDFSTSGLSFLADPSLKENEVIRVYFFLPGEGSRIQLNAVIVRKSLLAGGECLYGARFGENDQALLNKISDFIDRGK